MGCELEFNGKKFSSKAELAKYMSENRKETLKFVIKSDEKLIKKNKPTEEDNLMNLFEDFDSFQDKEVKKIEDFLDKNIKNVDEELVENNQMFSKEIQDAIELMSKEFQVVVIPSRSISGIGELLPANHPLSIKNKKPVILINPEKANSESVYHEFSHLYIDLLGGSNNAIVKSAFDELEGSELHEEIKEKYFEEELDDEYIMREVLATSMGRGAALSLGKETTRVPVLSRIIDSIYQSVANLLGVRKSSVEKLSNEIIGKRKIQKTAIQEYNTTISQKQKDNNVLDTKEKALEFVRYSKNKLRPVVHGVNRFYEHDDYEGKKVGITHKSGTNIVHAEIGKFRDSFSKGKIKYNIPFERSEWSLSSIQGIRNSSSVPIALSEAIDFFLRNKGIISKDEKKKDTWVKTLQDEYLLEAAKKRKNKNERAGQAGIVQSLSEEERLELIGPLMSGPKSENVFQDEESEALALAVEMRKKELDQNEYDRDSEEKLLGILSDQDNYEEIMALADRFQEEKDAPSKAGNIVHLALENMAKGEITNTVNFSDGKITAKLLEILKRGKEEGSNFFTEVSFYDPINKIPFTIDLLEITSEGKFRIYDYKGKFKLDRKNDPEGETSEQRTHRLFIDSNYVAQLHLYGVLLENLGLKPAPNTFSLLMYKTEYRKNTKPIVSNLEEFTWSKQMSAGSGINRSIFRVQQETLKVLARMAQKPMIDVKSSEKSYEEVRDSFYKKIGLLKTLIRSTKGSLNTEELNSVKAKMIEIKNNKDKLDKEKLKLHIEEMVNGTLAQMTRLENIFEDNANRSMQDSDMASFKYILQAADILEPLLKIVRDDKKNELDFDDIDGIKTNLSNIISNISSSKRYYYSQIQSKAAMTLGENSNYFRGKYRRDYELELRKTNPLIKSSEIDALTNKYLIEKSEEIDQKEHEYWLDKIENGFVDLRVWEYWLADPGISKSQFVQVGKRMMDKSETKTKRELNTIIPEIIRWQKELFNKDEKNMEKAWGFAQEKKQVLDLDGNKITLRSNSVTPEYTSDYRDLLYSYINQKEYYLNKFREAKEIRQNKKLAKRSAKEEEILNKVRALNLEFKEKMDGMSKLEMSDFKKVRKNPDFEKLSEDQKKSLKFIHKRLREADKRIDNYKNRLVKVFFSDSWKNRQEKEYKDVDAGIGNFIYNLPRKRMGTVEAINAGSFFKEKISRTKEFFSPAEDREDLSLETSDNELNEEELEILGAGDSFNKTNSDIENNEIYDVPVLYRNNLRSDSDLQSWDIPSLLSDNDSTTVEYKNNKEIEVDLFMVMEALKNGSVKKTDSIFSGIVKGAFDEARKSEDNLVLKAFANMVENRIYRRHYSGIYNKGTYIALNTLSKLKMFTSINTLTGNYMSMLNTMASGVTYQLIEANVGEYFDKKGFLSGMKKTKDDMGQMMLDTQRNYAESKSLLLLDLIGLQARHGSLINSFAEKSFAAKNLSVDTMFALTSFGERMVASNLMYAVMSKIKILNSKGDYVDSEGNVTNEENAMTYDEAFSVVDGALVLNKHAKHTSWNPAASIQENGEINDTALTDINKFVESIYADMFGQYNPNAKSVLNSTVIGSSFMSMRNWLPRGVNRRYRGITSLLKKDDSAFGWFNLIKNVNSFEDIHSSSEDMLFYSQDKQAFQEGYHVTHLRYLLTMAKDLKKAKNMEIQLSSNKIKATMTRSQLYNLKRSRYELITTALTFLLRILTARLLAGLDDDEKDSATRQRAYFAAYAMVRLSDEFMTYLSPEAMFKTTMSGGAVLGQLEKIGSTVATMIGIELDEETEISLIVFGVPLGSKHNDNSVSPSAENKSIKKLKGLIPGYSKISSAKGILGLQSDEQDFYIEDSYKFYLRNR